MFVYNWSLCYVQQGLAWHTAAILAVDLADPWPYNITHGTVKEQVKEFDQHTSSIA